MKVLLILFIAATLFEASADDGHSSGKRSRIRPQLRQLPNEDLGDEITTSAAPSFPMHRSYLPVKVCEKLFYCLPQLQGPCPVNKMMAPHDGSVDDHPIPCSSLAVYPFRGCVSSSHLSEELLSSIPTLAPAAKCVIRFPAYPCYGFPRHFRFYEPTKLCYPLGSYQRGNQSISSPCSNNETFADVDGRRGDCRCRDRHFLMLNGTCHRALTRGPCQSDEWLEPSHNGMGYCHPSPCSEGQRDGLHIFWNGPYSRPGCYKANTPGPCGEGAVFVIDDYLHQRGRCFWPYRPHSGHFRPAGRRPNHRRPRPQFGRRQENPLAAAGDRSRPASSSGPYANELDDDLGLGEDF